MKGRESTRTIGVGLDEGPEKGRGPQAWPFVDLVPGTRLAGRFLIKERLGAGATGTVFSALDTEVGQKIAVKVLRPEFGSGADRERLRREVRAARPGHPNLVTIFDLHEDRGRVFLSMELVSGCSLREELRRRKALPWHEVVGIGSQVAAGLGHLHSKGLVHRDIKPGNILLSADGVAKVCDMGLTRPVDQGGTVTATAMVVGTPSYMAPEQSVAGDLTSASDVYALGVTLFQALTGSVPLEGETAVRTAMLRQGARPPRARRSVSQCPRWLDRLLRRMLEPEPRDRPTARAVGRAFERGGFGHAPSKRTLRRGLTWGVLVAILASLGFGAWRRWSGHRLDPATGLHYSFQGFEDDVAVTLDDAKGNELETVMIGGRWRSGAFGGNAERRVAFGDFNGDGFVDAAVARMASESGRPLAIYLRQPDGTLRLAHEYSVELEYPYEGVTHTNFHIVDMISEDLDGDGAAELVLVEASSPYYPGALRVIDLENRPVLTLFHPGILMNVQVADRNNDGHPELYLGGTCNFLTPPESNTSAPVFLAVEADWTRRGINVSLFGKGRRLASTTPHGVGIHYASWPRVDVPAYHAAWQRTIVLNPPTNSNRYLVSLWVSLQDRKKPAPATGVRKMIRSVIIGRNLHTVLAQWEPTVATSLNIDPTTPEMQSMLKTSYWNGRSWQAESCFTPEALESRDR